MTPQEPACGYNLPPGCMDVPEEPGLPHCCQTCLHCIEMPWPDWLGVCELEVRRMGRMGWVLDPVGAMIEILGSGVTHDLGDDDAADCLGCAYWEES